MRNLAIFASGSGSNAENIIKYFQQHQDICVKLVLSNKKDAYVHTRAKLLNVDSLTFTREQFYESTYVIDLLKESSIDAIVLAGFLWLVPNSLIRAFYNKIINIHPALLPKYGGKGMYGMNVHKSVIENGENQSGITIHYVNEQYDEGKIIFSARCSVTSDDTPESLAEKVHSLEYEHFPAVIERWVHELNSAGSFD